MLLWNALLPGIFHNIGTITYWQAFGIFILSRILFGGFRSGHAHHFPHHGSVSRLKERWNKMSDEEREKIKEEWKKCCPTDKQ
jgi:Ca2+/H+ antiporter, TMEM165/GDT1 family